MNMEEKKEAGVSTWVWVVVIAIAAALVVGFVIFLRP
jgi:high-affinity Fe2+/Pb2+ permease